MSFAVSISPATKCARGTENLQRVPNTEHDDASQQWALDAHDMLVPGLLPGVLAQGESRFRFPEQLAAAARVLLLLVPRSQPEHSHATDLRGEIASGELSAMRAFRWHERRRSMQVTATRHGRHLVRLKVAFEGRHAQQSCDVECTTGHMRCTTTLSLDWPHGAPKPRALSLTLCYEDRHPAFERMVAGDAVSHV